jgi:hypothetical protein
MMFGGLGHDAMHGGDGEDAIVGSEALAVSYVNNYNLAGTKLNAAPLQSDYAHPFNPGNVLGYNPTTTKFALYDANDPLRKVLLTPTGTLSKTGTGLEWAVNFNHTEGPIDTKWIVGTAYAGVATDGDDHIFGDMGHDWLVGGTGRDTLWLGWGDDYGQADDNLSTAGGLNSGPDTNPSWEDFAYGGAGRDVLVANTGGDRLQDWTGEFNSFIVPYHPFGEPTVKRTLQPAMEVFMYALAKSQGADPTLAAQYGGDPARNGEPFGELGMVRQQDAAWNDQHGGPRDPQGPNAKAKRDVHPAAGVQPLYEESASGAGSGAAAGLSDADLAPIVAAATQFWTQALGAGDARLAMLRDVSVQVGNLQPEMLGVTIGHQILIDSDAAGHGWFIDASGRATVAAGQMDLLTVVAHELGNAMGFAEDARATELITSPILAAGDRNLVYGIEAGERHEASDDRESPRGQARIDWNASGETPLTTLKDHKGRRLLPAMFEWMMVDKDATDTAEVWGRLAAGSRSSDDDGPRSDADRFEWMIDADAENLLQEIDA